MKIKKTLSLILSFILLIGTVTVPAAFAADDSVPDGFTAIYNNDNLNAIRNNLSGRYILMNNLDLSSETNWQPIGDETSPFTGVFYGNGYSIKNMEISVTPETKYDVKKCGIGLFGKIDEAVIANVNLENVNISVNYPFDSGYPTGTIAGICNSSYIFDCTASGNINSTLGGFYDVGGITGTVSDRGNSFIANCINFVNINIIGKKDENSFGFAVAHTTEVGGIAGSVYGYNIVSKCINNGSITIEPINTVYTGGIVGAAYYNAPVIDCANRGDITVAKNAFAGGICGQSHSIVNSYNVGSVTIIDTTYAWLGGIAGVTEFNVDESHQNNSNATNAMIANCYYINDFNTAISNANEGTLTSVKALNVEEMKSQDSYAGFDFENTWTIAQGNTPTIKNAAINLPIEKIELAADEAIPLPPNVISVNLTNDTIASIDSKGNIEGVVDGEIAIEIITFDGKYQIVEISVIEEDDFFEVIKRRIVFFFVSAFEFFFSLFNVA